jgi:hypothetical protein
VRDVDAIGDEGEGVPPPRDQAHIVPMPRQEAAQLCGVLLVVVLLVQPHHAQVDHPEAYHSGQHLRPRLHGRFRQRVRGIEQRLLQHIVCPDCHFFQIVGEGRHQQSGAVAASVSQGELAVMKTDTLFVNNICRPARIPIIIRNFNYRNLTNQQNMDE